MILKEIHTFIQPTVT